MKKVYPLLLAMALALSLAACGGSDTAALQEEAEALRQQAAQLEAENERLLSENSDLKNENYNLRARAKKDNPIDLFFDSVDDSNFCNANLNVLGEEQADAWEAECRNVAEWLKNQLPRQDERELVDVYMSAAGEQLQRLACMSVWGVVDDLTLPMNEQTSGNLSILYSASARHQSWKSTFYQLLYAAPHYDGTANSESTYQFLFDADVEQTRLDSILTQ